MAAIPNVTLSQSAGGVGIIVPGVGALPVNVAGWTSIGPAGVPTLVGVGQVPALSNIFGVGPAVELAASILANGAPQGVIVTRIYDGAITSSAFTHTGSGSPAVHGAATTGNSPLAPYGTATATGSTGPLIVIILGGALATMTFQVSLDGGITWSATITSPAGGTYAIPNTNITLTFAAGTYVLGDTYAGPITTSLGASYTFLNGVNTLMSTGTPGAQQVGVPGSSVSGGGLVTMDATNNPQDAFAVQILISTSGVLGVGQFEYSIDGGLTFNGPIQIPSGGGPTPLGSTGIAIDWANANVQASLNVPSTTGGDGILWTAVPIGAAGNLIKIVQNAPSGGSSTAAITTSGAFTVVTISPKSGETNAGLITAIASSVAAEITGVATGGSDVVIAFSSAALAGGLGGGGTTSGFVAGETYKFTTVPPAITNSDILLVGENITGNSLQWDWMHVVGRPSSISAGVTIATTLDTIANYWFSNVRYSFCVQDQVVDTASANVDAPLVTAYAAFASDFVATGAGDCNIVSAVTGSEVQRCASWAASIWGATKNIGTDLAEVDLGNLPFVAQLLLDQNTSPTLCENRFTTLRTIPTETGFFVTNAFIMSNPGTSDITYWQSRRVLNQACRIAYEALVTYLSKPILVSATTGQITPAAATAIQNFVIRELNAGLSGQVSGVSCIVNTTNDILTTETLEVTVGVVPLAYPKYVDATIGFVNPALSTQ